ncbi:TPA: radical SAM protein [Candidatus Poribacteria bacterium]|nr:radical SAM protein [Candidatus Poribacteria bacterium]HEX30595.1 radical SAM protein [Candidatus Poribacteria bacterium]
MRLERNPEVILLEEENGAILYDPRSESAYAVNEAGLILWKLCDGSITREELEEALAEGFGKESEMFKDSIAFLDLLAQNGLISGETPPREEGEQPEREEGIPALSLLYLYITDKCNLACQHCWVTPTFTDEPVEGSVSLEDYKRFIEQAIPLGLSGVKITGGEPLLWEKLPELIEFLSSKKIGISIETNGTLINEEFADLFRSNDVSVSVSIDAAEAEIHDRFRGRRGAFEMALKGLKILIEHDLEPLVIMALYRENMDQIEPLLKLCSELGVKRFKINPVNELGRGKNLAKRRLLLSRDELIELLEKSEGEWQDKYGINVLFTYPCSLKPVSFLIKGGIPICPFKNLLSVLADGSITFCGFGYSEPRWIMGNIKDVDLESLWRENDLLREARESIPDKLEGICGKCILKNRCQGGCRAMAMEIYGSLTAPDPTCQAFYDAGQFPETRMIPHHTPK